MADPTRSSDSPPVPDRVPQGPPRWVKMLGIALAVLVLLLAIMLLSGGEHGAGRHGSTGGPSVAAVPPSHAGGL